MQSLTQLQSFVESVRARSFGAAARKLGSTTPAVSELVRRLERDLGVPLFSRGPRTLTLTPAGELLYPHASRSVAAAEDGEAAVKALHRLAEGHARFGLLKNTDLYLRGELATRFRAEYPGVRLTLTGQNSSLTAAAVAAGQLEAGLVVLPIEEMELLSLPVARDEIRYVSTSSSRGSLDHTIQQLASAPLVLYDASLGTRDPLRRQIAERAHRAGLRITPDVDVEHLSSALALVMQGGLDTLAPHAAVPPTAPSYVLKPPMHDVLAVVKRANEPLSSATRELVRLTCEALWSWSDTEGSTVEILATPADVVNFLQT